MNKERTILVTGGHLTPAVATIESLRQDLPQYNILYVGRAVALEGSRITSEEQEVMRGLGVPFIDLPAGRFPRSLSVLSLLSVLRIPWGIVVALLIIVKTRPSLILSFGGYIAFPLALAGWLLGVPILTHEQTRTAGLTNRWIARLARRVGVSFSETLSQFPVEKTVFTGPPLRSELFTRAAEPSFAYEKAPILFVTGGATGAVTLNDLVYPIIPKLTRKWMIIHQTGRFDDKKGKEVRAALSPKEQSRYVALPYITGSDYAWIMQHATLILGRSGANTVGEIAALGKVAVCVPLPWSAQGEQESNARYLQKNGTAMVLDQRHLSPDGLAHAIDEMTKTYKKYVSRARELSLTVPRDGAARLVREAASLLGTTP